MVELRVSGPGGHTARPGRTVDLVDVLARLVTELPPVLDELAGRPGAFLLVFGAVHSGDAANVIPSQGVLRGTLRTLDIELWRSAPELMEKAVARVLSAGDDPSLSFNGNYAAVYNIVRAQRDQKRLALAVAVDDDRFSVLLRKCNGDVRRDRRFARRRPTRRSVRGVRRV